MADTATQYVKDLTSNKYDPDLGGNVRAHLTKLGLENTIPENYDPVEAFNHLEDSIGAAFTFLGLDPKDPSTKDTPRRFATMFIGELTTGLNYDFFPKCTVQPNGTYERMRHPGVDPNDEDMTQRVGGYNQMVRVKAIDIMSMCEHHLQTISGVCHIAYIPKTKVLGLSKFARVAEFFARRPQIQEKMTEQIFEALKYILETDDIAVIIDAEHFCMKARGVLQAKATTQTNKMGGRFMTVQALREEFINGLG